MRWRLAIFVALVSLAVSMISAAEPANCVDAQVESSGGVPMMGSGARVKCAAPGECHVDIWRGGVVCSYFG
jgi:hypothetical protein